MGGAAAATLAALLAFVLLIAVIVATEQNATPEGDGGGGGVLNAGQVPAAFAPWLQRAGSLCPAIGAPLLAAQLQQESNFNTAAVSPAGAQGPAQFMPGTWPSWGRDDDGNGRASPFDIGDAVMAQGRYMCALAAQMSQALAAGRVQGSLSDLALAAYNAGPGGVLAARGVPSNGETDRYVASIHATLGKFGGGTAPSLGGTGTLVPNDGSFPSRVVLSAQRWIGKPYVWGGGDINGPTGGGFDCSGLALNAIYQASGGTVTLPHSAAEQAKLGTPVSGGQLRPGDLVFFADTPTAAPHHVGVYVGNSSILDAPDFGKTVTIDRLDTPYYQHQTITARRYG
jgi:cell wall-associated NlpC family hydrolase